MTKKRIVSGMRPTGKLHLGHFHGVLANWLELQKNFHCFFFAADWHSLTTEYADTAGISESIRDMVLDWLAFGIDPAQSTVFCQSAVHQHAELNLILSMITPVSWLERNPTYKEMQENLAARDLSTFGFLGYPVLMAADIILYRAERVPVGHDQLPHLEITREIARRFRAGEALGDGALIRTSASRPVDKVLLDHTVATGCDQFGGEQDAARRRQYTVIGLRHHGRDAQGRTLRSAFARPDIGDGELVLTRIPDRIRPRTRGSTEQRADQAA